MNNSIYNMIPLDKHGISNDYLIDKLGRIYSQKAKRFLKQQRTYKLKNAEGNYNSVSIKTLYRKIFNKEFCIDNIQDIDGEQWKEIEETNGKYFVSNMGRIKSYCRYYATILSLSDNGNGYKHLWINNKLVYIHQIVAKAFVLNENPLADTVDHKDNNKSNNNADNLQWLTQGDNVRKAHNKPL